MAFPRVSGYGCSRMLCFPSISGISVGSSSVTNMINIGVVRPLFSLSAASKDQFETGNLSSYSGVQLDDVVGGHVGKFRVDSWISSRINGVSRARVQYSIKLGLVSVNGLVVNKASQVIKAGDRVKCTISELLPLKAEPEAIPLDVVYEDDHVLLINKPPHMVVHPAPGNPSGTLVNGLLHHCSNLPVGEVFFEDETGNEENLDEMNIGSTSSIPSIRPGIVHRLDKGTSGLLIVAKNECAHACLSQQFKLHTIKRVYVSLTSGVPSLLKGRIDVPIGRDVNNRVRMAAMRGMSNRAARQAASRFKVIEILAGGGSALVEWRLETGRTHQIRAHAKYIGVPLLGDEVYGGTSDMAFSLIRPKIPPCCHSQISTLLSSLKRPCLHALSLGFKHPTTGKEMDFSCPPPWDFADTLIQLRNINI